MGDGWGRARKTIRIKAHGAGADEINEILTRGRTDDADRFPGSQVLGPVLFAGSRSSSPSRAQFEPEPEPRTKNPNRGTREPGNLGSSASSQLHESSTCRRNRTHHQSRLKRKFRASPHLRLPHDEERDPVLHHLWVVQRLGWSGSPYGNGRPVREAAAHVLQFLVAVAAETNGCA
jgi:hypothetical protein